MDKIIEIPDEPEIPLGNYLLALIDEKDNVGNSLYLYNLESFTKEIWNEIIDKRKKIGVRKVLPRELCLEPTHLYAIMKGKRGISIQSLYKLLGLWKRYCDKDNSDMKRKWEEIYNSNFLLASFSKPEKFALPRFLTPKLSYLMGWFVGDGCFDSHNNHYRLKITEENREQLEIIIKPLIEEIFKANCYIRNDHPSPCIKIHSKPIFRFFENVLDVKVGKIPRTIKDSDIINKRFFLRGLFDSEGDVDDNYLRSRVRISQASAPFLAYLIKTLKENGIKANGPYSQKTSRCMQIEIRGKGEILKFKEKIGSSHVEKAKKLENLAEEIRSRYRFI